MPRQYTGGGGGGVQPGHLQAWLIVPPASQRAERLLISGQSGRKDPWIEDPSELIGVY